jgi:hypothetical protein
MLKSIKETKFRIGLKKKEEEEEEEEDEEEAVMVKREFCALPIVGAYFKQT